MKKIAKLVALLLSFLSVIGLVYYAQIRYFSPGTLTKQKGVRYSNTPTVFIHGYQGSSLSFGPLLKQLESENIAKREMTIVVKSDGKLSVEGELTNNHDNPTIMVLFSEDVTDEIQQSKWIAKVMHYLYQQHVTTLNLVAHSMGGVSTLRYLLEYADSKVPRVAKLVTIAAPFNDLEIAEDTEEIFAYELTEDGPVGQTPIYEYFDQAMNRLPNNLAILNVAGDLQDGTDSDGSVSTHSAFSLRFLLQKHTKNYQELLIKGRSGGHSAITRSKKLRDNIIAFLWR
ncbi:alpha/beta hydrolase [Enterococcus sp. AZ072]|uniref:alpha/beta hydrolase n=1 Tax=unclassified Enterococcus TaxID=2608891 RepID=UPI003D2A8724